MSQRSYLDRDPSSTPKLTTTSSDIPLTTFSPNRAPRNRGSSSISRPAGSSVGMASTPDDRSENEGLGVGSSARNKNGVTGPRRTKKKSRLSDADEPRPMGNGGQQTDERAGLLSNEGQAEGWDDGDGDSGSAGAGSLKGSSTPARTRDRSRTIPLGPNAKKSAYPYPPNTIRNQKYSVVTFLPLVFYEQFKFFFNLYFLLVALSQFIPALKIGFIVTYIAPLAFVLCITMGKEAYDDYQRHLRDQEANSTKYLILDRIPLAPPPLPTSSTLVAAGLHSPQMRSFEPPLTRSIPSSKIKVGDLVLLEKNMRVPADMVLLRTSEGPVIETEGVTSPAVPSSATSIVGNLIGEDGDGEGGVEVESQVEATTVAASGDEGGTCFVRTDQLDGETDWKLRIAVGSTQAMSDRELAGLEGELFADPPIKDIHNFIGNLTLSALNFPTPMTTNEDDSIKSDEIVPLSVDNVLWANTVLAAGSAVGLVVYTGKESRAAMNTSEPETKVGLLDLEINKMAKTLCTVTFLLSVLLVALNGFRGEWYVYVFRFLILFSSIIPISLRVNLDMGKTVYARQIQTDKDIAGCVVRTSTLPEELGRISYICSDKTGTLTQNEMEMKKLHMGTMAYGWDSMDEVAHQLSVAFGESKPHPTNRRHASIATGISMASRGRRDMSTRLRDAVTALATCHNVTPVTNDDGTITYQASSPDEVAIVKWTESVGLTLISRERTRMTLRDAGGGTHVFEILMVFPFTSESKRMGIVIKDASTGEITFVQKGADVIMATIVQKNDWLDEETGNMAREGLRTLVLGRKRLTAEAYETFEKAYKQAQISLTDRSRAVAAVVSAHLEHNLELLALTGVEDKLQDEVKSTLELLRNAGIKIWMLTGDKLETAKVISLSSKLVARGQYIHAVSKLKTTQQASDQLDFLRTKLDCALLIDGESLQLYLDTLKYDFINIATQLSVVVACRCSPTQKADIARLIRSHTGKRVCCIGDGGNDVSMIQAADVGVGIVGKEGKQASLAADFSINQFSHLTKLLLWHGRNSYKRSAKLAQFVIHRGLIISVIQAVFSSIFFFAPIALYQGWLQVGYATLYTMAPVFSLVWDRDVSEELALLYPELYKELTKGRSLSTKTFFTWLLISVYQGGAIMVLSLLLFEAEFINIVAISFTALIVNELIMVALEITTWHPVMVLSEIFTFAIYAASMVVLPEYFDTSFILSQRFLWKVGLIIAVSSFPLYLYKVFKTTFRPTTYAKVQQY